MWDRLVFIGTRLMPAICIAGAVHLTIQEIFNPVSPEQQASLQKRRKRRTPLTPTHTEIEIESESDQVQTQVVQAAT